MKNIKPCSTNRLIIKLRQDHWTLKAISELLEVSISYVQTVIKKRGIWICQSKTTLDLIESLQNPITPNKEALQTFLAKVESTYKTGQTNSLEDATAASVRISGTPQTVFNALFSAPKRRFSISRDNVPQITFYSLMSASATLTKSQETQTKEIADLQETAVDQYHVDVEAKENTRLLALDEAKDHLQELIQAEKDLKDRIARVMK